MKQYKVTYICIKEHTDFNFKVTPVGKITNGMFMLNEQEVDSFKHPYWAINTFEEIVDKSPPVPVPVKNIRWLNRV